MNHNISSTSSCPATQALNEEKQKLMVPKERRRAEFEPKISLELFSMNLIDDLNSFPPIEWTNEDSDSDSVKSLDSWLMTKNDSKTTSIGNKRGLTDSPRPLVRSKKIKSDLYSLALGLSAWNFYFKQWIWLSTDCTKYNLGRRKIKNFRFFARHTNRIGILVQTTMMHSGSVYISITFQCPDKIDIPFI